MFSILDSIQVVQGSEYAHGLRLRQRSIQLDQVGRRSNLINGFINDLEYMELTECCPN